MLASEMVTEIYDHGYTDISDLRVLSFLNDTYYEFCSLEAWPFLEVASTSINTAAGTKALALPSNFRAVLQILNNTTGNVLSPERRETIQKRFSQYLTQQGEPAFYYRLGGAINMYPVPGSVYSLELDYLQYPVALTTPTTGGTDSTPIFNVAHHRVLVLGALSKAAALEDDPDTAEYFDGLYQAKVGKIRTDLWNWQYDRPDRIIDLFENDALDY